MARVVVFSANSTTEAYLLQGLLAQHGIEAEVTGHYLQGAFGELPVTNMIQILVDRCHEQRAKDVIEKYDRGEFDTEDDTDDNTDNNRDEG